MKNTKNRKGDNAHQDNQTWYRRDFYGWDSWPGDRSVAARYLANCWRILRSPHYRAVLRPQAGPEKALVEMVRGWVRYADTCLVPSQRANNQAPATQAPATRVPDVQAWSRIGHGLQGLLSGPLGRLERSSLSGLLCYMLQVEGYPAPEDSPDRYDDDLVGLNDWEKEQVIRRYHLASLDDAVAGMVSSWQRYAEVYRSACGSGIGQDDECGPAWTQIGNHLLMLWRGETQRDLIRRTLKAEASDTDTL